MIANHHHHAMDQRSKLPPDWVLHKVPLDIWRAIFHIFHHECSIITAASEMISLSHVCSSWRATIKDAPELWTKVGLVTRTNHCSIHYPSTKTELLSLVLERSKGMPLTTMNEFSETRTRPPPAEFDLAPVELFLKATARARTSDLDLPALGAVLFIFQQIDGISMQDAPSLHLLEELTLFTVYYQ